MASERLASEMVSEDDKYLIEETFKTCPEYIKSILLDASKCKALLDEVLGIEE